MAVFKQYLVIEVQDFTFKLPKETFEAVIKDQIDRGTKDLSEAFLEEYDKRNNA